MKRYNEKMMVCLAVAGMMLLCPAVRAEDASGKALSPQQVAALHAKYESMLAALRAEILAVLPEIEEQKKQGFWNALEAQRAQEKPQAGIATAADMVAYKEEKAQLEAELMHSARSLLAELDDFLERDALDGKLAKLAILVDAGPGRLAAFAAQGQEEEALLDTLFADEALMIQIMEAGGARKMEYGEAMQDYTRLLQEHERARERGTIFQRLALGTALERSPLWRYGHYEKAYLNGELDPAFPDMTVWECRMITNGSRTDEDLTWFREMLRTYRPDHIRNPNYNWRYTRIVKSDMPYRSTRHRPDLGTLSQYTLALGGTCGPRAWFGRLAARAFGIPSRKHPQTGHGAMSHWTPTGWVVNFGAWWSNSPGGLDFYLDSRAREFPEDYMKILRAQWAGDALGEEDVDQIYYGKGGGFWKQMAFRKKEVIVDDAKIAQTEEEKRLAAMTAEEARVILGESDETLDGPWEQPPVTIPEEYRRITFADDGSITIPAVACVTPTNNTRKILFLKSWEEGWQVHYKRTGNRPELIKYDVELPADGTYELTARLATVAHWQQSFFRVNRRTLINVPLPYTKGFWQKTDPVTVDLRAGRNTIMFTCKNRGVSIKSLHLTPVR